MKLSIRRANPEDAQGVWLVAQSRSKQAMIERGEATEENLSRDGFLLYPLEAVSDTQPNYRERIELSEHFWVAAEGERIIAFNMAYTFQAMQSFAHLTSNDISLLKYFTNQWGCERNCIYMAQGAVLFDHANQGVMGMVVAEFLTNAANSGAPAVIGEIAQAPIKNKASTAAAEKLGFSMVATRTKIDPTTGLDRISGTFLRTLPLRARE